MSSAEPPTPAAPNSKPSEALLAEQRAAQSSNASKTAANALFAARDYDEAITTYQRALDDLGLTRLHYEVGVLKSNIAACYTKLEEWEKAVSAATDALEALAKALPEPGSTPEEGGGDAQGESHSKGDAEGDDEDRDGEGDAVELEVESVPPEHVLEMYGHAPRDVARMRGKSLLRRAMARSRLGGWAALQGADEDYKELANMPQLAPLDRAAVQKALRELPGMLEEAKQKEIGDMTAKLKQLGNGILKPFGLSTDNFAMVKDESTGGYSIQFNQNK